MFLKYLTKIYAMNRNFEEKKKSNETIQPIAILSAVHVS